MTKPTVAILGASTNRDKFGNKAVRAFAANGFEVFPIHPSASEIEGIKAYRSVADVPVTKLDRVSLYVPPNLGVQLLDEIARKGVDQVWVNPGAESDALRDQAHHLGLTAIYACSIVAIGASPADYD